MAVAATLVRGAYLLWFCPYALIEDEAHYWEWSRRLEWSYYSKGPGIAWVIALSTRAFHALGLGLNEAAVRMPAPLFGGVLVVAAAGVAGAARGNGRARVYAAACVLLAPAFWMAGMLVTIDGPYAACWGLAAWAAWLALRRGSGRAWLGLGAALGVGFLFKYTILLLVPGIVVYACRKRGRLCLAPSWRVWAIGGLALLALGLVPVLVWNEAHGWPTVRHLLGHLRLQGGDTKIWPQDRGWHYKPTWTLELIGTQIALGGPALLMGLWAAWRASKLRHEDPDAWTDRVFLLWCAAPIFAFYLAVSFVAEPEGNWPLAGHVTLLALAGWGAAEAVQDWKERVARWRALPEPRPREGIVTSRPETWPRLLWRFTELVGVGVAVLSLRVDWVAAMPPMTWIEAGLKSSRVIPPDRPMVPLGRLMGADTIARSAAAEVDHLSRREGNPAFVVAQQYGRASQLAFYMPGRPIVYCSSSKSDGRRTQYDLWPETSLDDPGLFGRPALLIGGHLEDWTPAFDRVEEIGPLHGETKKDRVSFFGSGYRGWPRGETR
jgi:hypothetical protein